MFRAQSIDFIEQLFANILKVLTLAYTALNVLLGESLYSFLQNYYCIVILILQKMERLRYIRLVSLFYRNLLFEQYYHKPNAYNFPPYI